MKREELRREYSLKLKFTTSSTRITQLLLEYDKKLQELDALPPAEGAKTCWGCGAEIHYLSNGLPPYRCDCGAVNPAETMERQPQPTAEGAEEILASIVESLGEPINIHNHVFEIRPYTVEHKTEWWIFHKEVSSGEPLAQWLDKFAALHAQKIADKMVEDMRAKLFSMRATKNAMDKLSEADRFMMYGYHDCINEMLMWTKSLKP